MMILANMGMQGKKNLAVLKALEWLISFPNNNCLGCHPTGPCVTKALQ